MAKYAAGTKTSVGSSRDEIERMLVRYGADGFGYASDSGSATVMFDADGRRVRFTIAMPFENERDITHTPTGLRRTAPQIHAAYDLEVRRRWRCVALAIKAKLEVVASGISTFEEEFAAQIVLPDGSTVGDWLTPQIARAYELGSMPPMLSLSAGDG